MSSKRTNLPKYSARKKFLALLLASCYLLQPLQGTIAAGFHELVHALEAPGTILGHSFEKHGAENIHHEGEHVMLSDEEDDFLATIWEGLTDSDRHEPCSLPDANAQDKHISATVVYPFGTRPFGAPICVKGVSLPPLVVYPVPGEPPRLV